MTIEDILAKMIADSPLAAIAIYVLSTLNKNVESLTNAVKDWNKALNERLTALEDYVKARQHRHRPR